MRFRVIIFIYIFDVQFYFPNNWNIEMWKFWRIKTKYEHHIYFLMFLELFSFAFINKHKMRVTILTKCRKLSLLFSYTDYFNFIIIMI